MEKYDVAVIGGGPGGYVAAIRTASSGKKTVLIEKSGLGGVCLNWGCIPTKSLLRNAEVIRTLGEGEKYGFTAGKVTADYAAAQKRSREVSARLVRGIEYLMKKNGVTVIKDTAEFADAKTLRLKESGRRLSFGCCIIAAGSTPRRFPSLDYGMDNVLDSKKVLKLTELPESLLVIGAGAIGMEFATVFSSYGCAVTVAEVLPHILPQEDALAAECVRKAMEKRGVRFYEGAKVKEIKSDGGRVSAVIECAGKAVRAETAAVLTAVGISPDTSELGLDKIGVVTDERGYIKTDGRMRTDAAGIYAIGDVTGRLALAHAASAQGMIAADDICGRETKELRYSDIPRCTYTCPEVASAGLTLKGALDAGYDAAEAVFPLSANGKAIASGDDTGFAKLIYDKKYGQLLGAVLTGEHVTEMIYGITGYLGLEMTVDEMAGVVHPHPTMSEAIMEAAHIAEGRPVHI